MFLRSLACVALLALLPACATSGHQRVPRPDESTLVSADRCRVYVAREDVLAGTAHKVRVLDGEEEIGTINEGEYLCWERRPAQGLGTLYFEGVGPKLGSVENVFDLPRQAGTTTYFAIEITGDTFQPKIKEISGDAGRALIAQRKPAAH